MADLLYHSPDFRVVFQTGDAADFVETKADESFALIVMAPDRACDLLDCDFWFRRFRHVALNSRCGMLKHILVEVTVGKWLGARLCRPALFACGSPNPR